MKNNILISINELNDIKKYKEVGINTFLFALSNYSIGYPNTFDIETINKYQDSYILINILLNTDQVEELKKIIPKIKCRGIVYEDIAVYQLVKELNLDLELIIFQNHFATNIESINYWLKSNDSIIISNELTLEEIKSITQKSKKPVIIHLLGYNQAMYSKRKLLSNYQEYFKLDNNKEGIIEEEITKYKFKIVENNLGTVIYDNNIFYGRELLDLKPLYFYINSSFLTSEEIIQILKNNNKYFNGFLNKKTIFKIEEVKK